MNNSEYLFKDIMLSEVKNRGEIVEVNINEHRKRKWKEKPMNGQFLRDTEEQAADDSWLWLKRGCLKRET